MKLFIVQSNDLEVGSIINFVQKKTTTNNLGNEYCTNIKFAFGYKFKWLFSNHEIKLGATGLLR